MGDAGFLTIPAISAKKRADSSVMLMDCEKMLRVWSLEDAQHERARSLLDRALAVPGLHGLLEPAWNARDDEYVEGRSKLIHYTILHTQPWGPLPDTFVYQKNAPGELWYDLEREADGAGYFVFGPNRPSDQFTDLAARLENDDEQPTQDAPVRGTMITDQQLTDILRVAGTSAERSVLEYRLVAPDGPDGPSGEDESNHGAFHGLSQFQVQRHGLTDTRTRPTSRGFDGTICLRGLEHLPEADVQWVLEDIFTRSREFVYISVENSPDPLHLADGTYVGSRSRGSSWWLPFLLKAGARHPELHWMFVLTDRKAKPFAARRRYEGGRRLETPPRVWLLVDDNADKRSQSEALAEALGWPYEFKELPRTRFSEFDAQVAKFTGISLAVGVKSVLPLQPPWPDLVIACGSRLSEAARQIAEASQGSTRVIQIDGRAGRCADPYDIAVSTRPTRLQPHPRRIETLTPLSDVTPERLAHRYGSAHTWGESTPRPHVLLLLGKASSRHELTPSIARQLVRQVRSFAEAVDGAAFAIVDAAVGSIVVETIQENIGTASHAYVHHGGDGRTAQHAWLADADAIVVAGDNEYCLADAVGTGKPVYLYPLPERTAGLVARLHDSIYERAYASPLNRRGTVRPQQALEYLCARSFERGILSLPRDRREREDALIKQKVVLPFGSPLRMGVGGSLRGAEEVAKRARRLLGFHVAAGER
jgi:mitochondrial fission protein ELM1